MESPGAGEYMSKPSDRDKVYKTVERRNPAWEWKAPKPAKKPEKAIVGPGSYKDLAEDYKKSFIKPRAKATVILKSARVTAIELPAKQKAYIPGVGKYDKVESAYKNFCIKHDRQQFMPKSQAPRFTDQYAKQFKHVPGPGAYDILPKSKYDKSYKKRK